MKKISIAVTAFLAASSVYAAGTAVCSAPTTAGNGVAIDGTVGYTGSASGFVINSFTPKCSANVYAAFEQTEIVAAVAAGSKKGKNLFAGSTNGGGVRNVNTTPYANGLAEGDTTGATAAQLTAGSN